MLIMLLFVLLAFSMVEQDNTAKASLKSRPNSFYGGCLLRGSYSDLGSCLRGGGDSRFNINNITEKVFSVLQIREAAMSAIDGKYNCSTQLMTVPSSRDSTVNIDRLNLLQCHLCLYI